jgi:anti-sigma factor RsiW
MTDRFSFSDEDLTAFLDGEADAAMSDRISAALESDMALQDRLSALDIPRDALALAFDPVLASAPPMPPLPDVEVQAQAPRGWGMLAAGLGGGLAAGIALAMSLQLGAPEPSQPGWLQVVANYQALYVPETLSKGPVLSANAKAEQLANLSNILDVDLSNLTLVGDLELQRAQQLGFRGKPLAQLAYVLPDGTPVAICILQSGKPASDVKTSEIEGLAAVHWTTGQHGVLVIGGNDPNVLSQIAPIVQASI